MSLCNTCRLSVVCAIIVLSSIDAPVVAFTLRRAHKAIDSNGDLAQEESVLLEVKRELNVPDNIALPDVHNNASFVPTISTLKFNNTTDQKTDFLNNRTIPYNPKEALTPKQTKVEKGITTKISVYETDAELKTIVGFVSKETTPVLLDIQTDDETTTFYKATTSEISINESVTTEMPQYKIYDLKNSTNSEIKNQNRKIELEKVQNKNHDQKPNPRKSRPPPKWKKYKVVERKRPSHSSEEKLIEKKKESHKEDILRAETANTQVLFKDSVTTVVPSTESSVPKLQSSESESNVTLESLVTEQSANTPVSIMSAISDIGTISQNSHESKRAGFLNYSGKTTTEILTETTAAEITTDSTLTTAKQSDLKTNEQRIFVSETPVHDMEDKKKLESQFVLNEDFIKEELLKEELINTNAENAKRQREEEVNDNADLKEIINVNTDSSIETNSSSEVSVKSKNNTLYTVSPNYKPMKKIEVIPPKQFVRDPDDNSWRNESLSSLGIVFKPKNSSKPFTQVLKNKTETEWNNFSEKDIKNDLPDLRERLQKMAEKRKSKRKKIDSFGNVVYFDYEENSNSAEHAVTTAELSSTVTTYSPILQTTYAENVLPKERSQNITNSVPPTLTTVGVNKNRYSTKMPGKFLQEYYDSTDEDDRDYLNMAQIDLKKFTTSLRTSTPFYPSTVVAKQPDWIKQTNKVTYNSFPERKATVQYFPPLTTQKVNVNDYDNGFNFKMQSFTTESDAPTIVLPAFVEGPNTPVTDTPTKADFTKSLLTQPQQTTDPGPALNDGGFDRGTYVLKHYKDFVNEAAKHAEYDKNIEYIPYTEAPVEGGTKKEHIEYEKDPQAKTIDSGYDYEAQFRKDVLQRFVDNFNQNSERYRSDFPILFNSSIIHRGIQNGEDTASSRAFMRGSYNSDIFKPKFSTKKACEPNCEKLTVELSPAYELHYYVPGEEEKEEVQPVTPPYQYSRL